MYIYTFEHRYLGIVKSAWVRNLRDALANAKMHNCIDWRVTITMF